MAHVSTVANAIVQLVAQALDAIDYAAGTTITTAAGPVIIGRGWPTSDAADKATKAGVTLVTVYAVPGMARNLGSQYGRQWVQVSSNTPTLIATVVGHSVEFSGTCSEGQVTGISVNKAGYTYRMTAQDTPETVAATLAAIIPGATVDASTVLLGPGTITAATVCDQSSNMETRRQEQTYRIVFWAPSPTARDRLSGMVDQFLSNVRDIEFEDGSHSGFPPTYRSTYDDDVPSKANLWRRDLLYSVSYPTIITEIQPSVLFVGAVLESTVPVGILPPTLLSELTR